MVSRRKFIAGCGLVPFLSYLSLDSVFAATPPAMLVMAMQLDNMTTLDPHENFEAVGAEIVGNIYQQLVKPNIDQPEILEGDLALSWKTSNNNKTFTFFLNKDAKFSDGKPVTAEDAAFSLQRVVKMDKGPAFIINQFGFTKDNVEDLIKATDKYTLEISTPEPASESLMLYCLAAKVGCIVQKSQVLAHQQGDDLGNAWLKQNSAGSGAFKLRSWNASESVILDSNTHSPKAGKIKRIILKHIVDPSAQLLMLQKGDVDIARDLTTEQLRKLIDDKNYKLVRRAQSAIIIISCNTAHPALSKPQVWQAIKWAVDYSDIQKNIVPLTHTIHQSFLPNGLPAAIKETPFHKDVAKAKALLAEAGYPNGFEITMDHYSAQPYPDLAQAIQANLAEIGIKANLLAGENRQVLTKMRARQHQMALTAWGADYFDPNANAEAFCMNTDNSENARSRTLAWRCSWQDDNITELAINARQEPDSVTRIALYEQLQKEHMNNSPFTIMLQATKTIACLKNVNNVVLDVFSNTTYDKVTKT